MKKHSFLFCLLLSLITLPQFAMGKCEPVGCSISSGNDDIRADTLENDTKGATSCYLCEKGYCEDGDIVFLNDFSKFKSCNQSKKWHHNDRWEDFTVLRCAEEKIVEKNGIFNGGNNTVKQYDIPGRDYNGAEKNIQSSVLKKGTNPCFYYVCKSDYLPNSERTGCVLDERETNCKNTGGTWSESNCICDENENIQRTEDGLECECIPPDYEWINQSDKKQGCKLTAVAQQRKQCTESGGEWSNDDCDCDEDKYLEKSGKECKCKDGYKYKNEDKKSDGCEITAVTQNAQKKDKCEKSKAAGQPVGWGNNGCYCIGIDGQYENIINTEEIYECKETKQYSACKKLGSSVAYWDNRTCHCKDKNKQFLNDNCNTNTDAYQQSLDAADAIAEIEKLGKELNDISATFDRSKWRDADGNFNTARLASDSVAAVVLGTAGGLISSKVIKKKQVENGFEDIKCTIGSQEVANWGDEFQVGIQ